MVATVARQWMLVRCSKSARLHTFTSSALGWTTSGSSATTRDWTLGGGWKAPGGTLNSGVTLACSCVATERRV